jgi:integrase
MVLAWQRSAILARAGELTRGVLLKTLNEMLERTTGERVERHSIRQFSNAWLKAKSTTGKSRGTTSRYKSIIQNFLISLGDRRADASLGVVTTIDIEKFRDLEIENGKSASTANLAVKILRALFNDAKRKGILLTNPADTVELVDAAAHQRQPFSDEDVARLLSVANVEWRGMILLGAHAGLRIGDAAHLRWEAIDVTNGTLTFIPQKTARRTRRRPQTIAMHSELLAYFLELPTPDQSHAPLFPSLHKRGVGGHQGLSNSFGSLIPKAKIGQIISEKPTGKGRSFSALSFHSLRHAFVSRLANAEITSDVRKEIAGHSSDEIHRRYTHLDISTQHRALSRLKPFSS